MALQVDQKLTDTIPAEAPLAMPVQDLKSWAGKPVSVGNGRNVFFARLFVFGASALITGFGTWKMYQVISPVNVTTLQVLFASFFALTFAWIAFSCASAILGFIVLLFGKARLPLVGLVLVLVVLEKDLGTTITIGIIFMSVLWFGLGYGPVPRFHRSFGAAPLKRRSGCR